MEGYGSGRGRKEKSEDEAGRARCWDVERRTGREEERRRARIGRQGRVRRWSGVGQGRAGRRHAVCSHTPFLCRYHGAGAAQALRRLPAAPFPRRPSAYSQNFSPAAGLYDKRADDVSTSSELFKPFSSHGPCTWGIEWICFSRDVRGLGVECGGGQGWVGRRGKGREGGGWGLARYSNDTRPVKVI